MPIAGGTGKEFKFKQSYHTKRTRQGSGGGTKYGRKKGSIKKYRGQGGRRKSVKH
jgi:hypothetical protein